MTAAVGSALLERQIEEVLGTLTGPAGRSAARRLDRVAAEACGEALVERLCAMPADTSLIEALVLLGLAHPGMLERRGISPTKEGRRLVELLSRAGHAARARGIVELLDRDTATDAPWAVEAPAVEPAREDPHARPRVRQPRAPAAEALASRHGSAPVDAWPAPVRRVPPRATVPAGSAWRWHLLLGASVLVLSAIVTSFSLAGSSTGERTAPARAARIRPATDVAPIAAVPASDAAAAAAYAQALRDVERGRLAEAVEELQRALALASPAWDARARVEADLAALRTWKSRVRQPERRP